MLDWQLPIYALIMARVAIIEGMKSDNILREQLGQSPAYNESDFNGIAMELEELAERAKP